LGTGCGGSGDDPVIAAAVIALSALTIRVDGDTIALLPIVPESWLGRQIDVRDLPTPHGRCSFSLRWHGARPALLWELDAGEPRDGVEPAPVIITTPVLDPSFRTDKRSGETLLAAPPTAGTTPAEPGASFR
jgi:hypothetical protein